MRERGGRPDIAVRLSMNNAKLTHRRSLIVTNSYIHLNLAHQFVINFVKTPSVLRLRWTSAKESLLLMLIELLLT